MLHQAVHTGDADGGKQSADGRRDQAHQQRDQHKHRLRCTRVDRERLQSNNCQEEDNCQPRQQDVERNFVRRLLPLRALHQRDHAIEKRFARVRRDADCNLVREHPRAAGHRRPIAARFTNHRGRLARNCRLVHTCHAADDLAVTGNHLACGDPYNVVRPQLGARPLFDTVLGDHVRRRLRLGFAKRIRLCFAASFRHRLGEVGEQNGEPEPQGDLQVEAEVPLMAQLIGDEQHCRQHAADLHHEHDRVLHHGLGIQLCERIHTRALHDLRIE